jgi:hypothetical protein|tara:strand:+ start:198 stop:437 length:240 start_codon:yes stop_codon:yes gene_type:complete
MKKRVAKRQKDKKHKISYEMKLIKRKNKVRWLCVERPTGSIITESEFEDEAQKVCDHQNKYKQWENQGGIVKHLTLGKI